MGILSLTLIVALVFMQNETFVVDLTDDTLATTVATHNVVFVKFYAPWCGHCKHLAPIYEEAAKEAKEKGYVFAQIDATANPNSASAYQIQGYPTLKLFINGSDPINFEGERSKDGMLKWITSMIVPPIVAISTIANNETSILLVGNKTLEEGLIKLARAYLNIKFSSCSIEEFNKKFHKQASKPMYVANNFERAAYREINITSSYDTLKELIKTLSYKYVIELTRESLGIIMVPNSDSLYLIGNDSEVNSTIAEFTELAKKYESIKFVMVNTEKPSEGSINNRFIEFLQLPSMPAFVFTRGRQRGLDKRLGGFDIKNLEKVINQYLDNKIPIYYKTEQVPAENASLVEADGVKYKKIVGETYESFKNNDYIIVYEAPGYADKTNLNKVLSSSNTQLKLGVYNIMKNENYGIEPVAALFMTSFADGGKKNVTMSSGFEDPLKIIEFLKSSYPNFKVTKYIQTYFGEEI